MLYLEIKTRKVIDSTLAKKLVDKGVISAVLTTGKITKPAKQVFDDADIAWAEYIPEIEFMNPQTKEEK